MKKSDKIFVAGHKGMVGSAIVSELKSKGYTVITNDRKYLDLTNQEQVSKYFSILKPDVVIIAAAKVGGIRANNELRAEFIYQNLMIQSNIIHSSYVNNVKKLLFLGSSCIYPKFATQPIKEEYLLSGHLEPTNSAYAIAKIAGIQMIQSYRHQYGCNYISVMPTNLYGFNDTYSTNHSHVIPAIIEKIKNAKKNNESVFLLGDGTPLREFLHASDLAEACILLLEQYNGDKIVNIGSNEEICIRDLAYLIADCMAFKGNIIFNNDVSYNGTPRKILDSSYLRSLIDWKPKYDLKKGIKGILKQINYETN